MFLSKSAERRMKPSEYQLSRVVLRNMRLARSQRTDWQFYQALVKKVLEPLVFHPLHAQWQREKEGYFSLRTALDNRARFELKEAFKILKERLVNAGLLAHDAIKQHVCIAESVLEFRREERVDEADKAPCANCGALKERHRPYVLPSYLYGMYVELQSLCDGVMSLGREDLLKDYVHIKQVNTYVHDASVFQRQYCTDCRYLYNRTSAPRNSCDEPIPFCELDSEWVCPVCNANQSMFFSIDSDVILTKVSVIESFIFAPAYFELLEMDMIFGSWKRNPSDAPTWVAFEILSSIRWSFEVSHDFLRKKNLHYNSPDACIRSVRLLELHSFKITMMSIKKKQQDKNESFYKRYRFVKALDLIAKEMMSSVGDQSDVCNKPFPLTIELLLEDHVHLRLKVGWLPGIFEFCDLHLFRDEEDNIIRQFIEDLLEKPGEIVSLDKASASGVNATKYLRRVGICPLLEKIFIANKAAYSAHLQAQCISLTDKPEAYLRKLIRKVEQLRTVRWDSIKAYKKSAASGPYH